MKIVLCWMMNDSIGHDMQISGAALCTRSPLTIYGLTPPHHIPIPSCQYKQTHDSLLQFTPYQDFDNAAHHIINRLSNLRLQLNAGCDDAMMVANITERMQDLSFPPPPAATETRASASSLAAAHARS